MFVADGKKIADWLKTNEARKLVVFLHGLARLIYS